MHKSKPVLLHVQALSELNIASGNHGDDCNICISLYSGLYQTVPEYGAPANVSRSFSEGEHYIEYRAVDSTGRTGICSFTVNVQGEPSHPKWTN